MKVVYMGTPDFAVMPLKAILDAGHEVAAVVTQPDRQKGRGREVQFSPVKEFALERGLPVLQPVKIKEAQEVEKLRQLQADIFVVAAFGQILSEEILQMPRFGCINIHASLLPKYRGAAPIQWAVLNGDEKSGVTIQQMAKGLDTGDILFQSELLLDKKETGGSLFDRLMVESALLIVTALEKLEQGDVHPVPQDEQLASYAGKLTKDMGRLDFTKTAEELDRWIRGLNPWPSAYTTYKGKTLKIWDAEVIPADGSGAACGAVTRISKEGFCIGTADGLLQVKSLQLEGKKRMSCAEFCRGYTLTEGEILGV